MNIPKENIVDLRKKTKKETHKKSAPKPAKKRGQTKLNEFDEFEVRKEVKVIALAITSIILVGLVAYFAVSKNYLAAFFFALAGATLAISIYIKNKSGKKVASRIRKGEPESLVDILSKIIGL